MERRRLVLRCNQGGKRREESFHLAPPMLPWQQVVLACTGFGTALTSGIVAPQGLCCVKEEYT